MVISSVFIVYASTTIPLHRSKIFIAAAILYPISSVKSDIEEAPLTGQPTLPNEMALLCDLSVL